MRRVVVVALFVVVAGVISPVFGRLNFSNIKTCGSLTTDITVLIPILIRFA